MAYSADMMRRVVARALEVGLLAQADPRKQRVKLDGYDFDLLTGGRCQEFVRECFESANGWAARTWKYAAPSAKVALQRMTRDGFRVTGDPRAGDVIGHCSGTYGHIAIVVGDVGGKLTCAENTSSGSRGNPRRAGTKLTAVADMPGITHVIRFCPDALDAPKPATPDPPQVTNAWQFAARDESGDIVATGRATTWWDHVTRTGVPADTPGLIACSLPRALDKYTAGSPFAGVPDFAIVRVYYAPTGKVVYAPVIDNGPGFQATAGTGKPGSAMIDLTRAAKQALGFATDMTNDTVTIRILRDSAAAGRKLCK